ncbi:hypothetical protein HYT17_02050 [Candidatus Microgenomates bacterium]|nr:hypothetical protein [Candidatus Microgenomates bacterium]
MIGELGSESPFQRIEKAPKVPNQLVFWLRMRRIMAEKPVSSESPPPQPDNPLASEVAQHAQIDWGQLKKDHMHKSGEPLTSAVYKLAKYMSKPPPPNEQATIYLTDNWRVRDGRHKVLALKVLGPEFIKASGMDRWVKIETSRSKRT